MRVRVATSHQVSLFLVLTATMAHGCSTRDSALVVDASIEAEADSEERSNDSTLHAFSRILWVGAHPDDEIPSSPLQKRLCSRPGSECYFISATAGETGNCELAGGCSPDLATVRAAEFVAMGIYLGGTVDVLGLTDGGSATRSGVLANWAQEAGGTTALVDLMKNAIVEASPDAILTFDPRHGTTCHPDHQAVGELAILAAQELGYPASALFVVESVIAGVAGSTTPGFRSAVPGDEGVETMSAEADWSTVIHLMSKVYTSQYTPQTVELTRSVEHDGKTTSIMSLDSAEPDDPRYAALCQ